MKAYTSMNTGDHVRQGDLLIIKIGEQDTPFTATEVLEDGILAIGEHTGYAHRACALDTNELSLSPKDLEFLEEQAARLLDPLVFQDEGCVRRSRIDRVPLVQEVIAKIHAPASFAVVHYDKRVHVTPVNPDAFIHEGGHESLLLPAGLYEVVRQVENTSQFFRVVSD